MVSFELGKEIEEDVSRLVTSVGQGNDSESPWGVEHASRILQELRIFSLFYAREKTKTSISIFLPSSKLTICHILFYKYDATNIADLSSLLDACHIDFVIDLTHRSCCCSVVEHRSTKSEDLMFDSSLELRIALCEFLKLTFRTFVIFQRKLWTASAWNVSYRNSLRWPISIFNSVDTKMARVDIKFIFEYSTR